MFYQISVWRLFCSQAAKSDRCSGLNFWSYLLDGLHTRALNFLCQRFCWPSITRDAKTFVAPCTLCVHPPVHILGVKDLLHDGKSLVWLSSTVKRPDGENEPDPRKHSPGDGSPAPCRLKNLLAMGGVHNSVVSADSVVLLILVPPSFIAPCLITRRKLLLVQTHQPLVVRLLVI